jgi:hypothetical protein
MAIIRTPGRRPLNRKTSLSATATLLLGFAACPAAMAQNAAVTVNVDVNANRHAISPDVYGQDNASQAVMADLNSPIQRLGGNPTSSYNWQLNSNNRAADYFFESLLTNNSTTPGQAADSVIQADNAAGAATEMTVPLLDWVSKLGPNSSGLWSFSVKKYGAQTYQPDAGNGILISTQEDVVGNDPNDAYTPNSVAFEQSWLNHMISTWGKASTATGVKYYLLDNESSIWFSTYRDVHPNGATMNEMWTKMSNMAAMIKATDPNALVAGPEEWGWTGYFYSGADQQYGGENGWGGTLPDRAAHNNMDYVPWLLQQFANYQKTNGTKLLDVLSLHYYPQDGSYGNAVDTATELLRNESTRSLWDPNYVDQSWINTQVELIPRMQQWVSTYDPGLKTAINEYNWGADAYMNGATTQADVLGIFGRQGLDIACRWSAPASNTPTYQAFKIYRNYDGNKSTFGDTSVSATVPDPDDLSAFASQDSATGTVKVMVISKVLTGTTPVTVNLANFTPGSTAQVYQFNPSSPTAISHLASIAVTGGSVSLTVPAQSVTLLVVPAVAVVPPKISGITLNPTTIAPGGSSKGTIALNSAAPTGGVPVSVLVNGFPYSTVVVPSGQTSATATFTTSTATPSGAYAVKASYNGSSATATLTVSSQAPTITSFAFTPSTIKRGATAKGTVTLSTAPSGGEWVWIFYDGFPLTAVDIGAGKTAGSFSLPTGVNLPANTYSFDAVMGTSSDTANLVVTS